VKRGVLGGGGGGGGGEAQRRIRAAAAAAAPVTIAAFAPDASKLAADAEAAALSSWLLCSVAPAAALKSAGALAPAGGGAAADAHAAALAARLVPAAVLLGTRIEGRLSRGGLAIAYDAAFVATRARVAALVAAGRVAPAPGLAPATDAGLRARLTALFLRIDPAWLRFGLDAALAAGTPMMPPPGADADRAAPPPPLEAVLRRALAARLFGGLADGAAGARDCLLRALSLLYFLQAAAARADVATAPEDERTALVALAVGVRALGRGGGADGARARALGAALATQLVLPPHMLRVVDGDAARADDGDLVAVFFRCGCAAWGL
jgi:hypothetical protein